MTRDRQTAGGRLARALRIGLLASAPLSRPAGSDIVRRRRVVVVGTLLVGAALLGLSLAVTPGHPAFYILSAATAFVWLAGGVLSGPLQLGRIGGRRPVVLPVVLGLLAAAVFVGGALIVRHIPLLAGEVNGILQFARQGSLPVVLLVTAISGVGEEVFFRGALYASVIRRNPVAVSAAVYTLTTVVSGNVMLIFAAALLSVLWGLERRASGGVLAPILTHVTWSLAMALILPPLFAR